MVSAPKLYYAFPDQVKESIGDSATNQLIGCISGFCPVFRGLFRLLLSPSQRNGKYLNMPVESSFQEYVLFFNPILF